MGKDQPRSYTCLIIDDETAAYKALSFYIARYPQLVVSGRAFNALEGLRLVQLLKPDVIFLNVTMPYMTGIEMLDHFSTENHYIILTSALQISTIRDERVNDYLEVPVSEGRLAEAIQRLERSILTSSEK
jgi:two-component system LytT family response regulator